MTVPPKLEAKPFISSATAERSTVICDRLAGVSKPPSALNASFLSIPGMATLASSENRAESAAALVCATFVKLESSGTAMDEPPQPAATAASRATRAAMTTRGVRTFTLEVCIDRGGSGRHPPNGVSVKLGAAAHSSRVAAALST